MSTIDERVAYLEGKVDEHSNGFGELRESVRQVDQKLDRLFASLNDRIVGVDQKLDRLIASVNDRIDGVDQSLSLKIDRLDDKMSRQFLWILGVQVAVLIAVVGALARG